ncbi:MAG: DUF4138 domain-containing protein [Flavobacteriales bacterium]
MKKIFFFLLIGSSPLFAQVIKKDTIYLTRSYNSHLSFGKGLSYLSIGSGVVAVNSAEPNRVNERQVVTVQAKRKFKVTNITAIANDNTYYEIVVLYTPNPPKKNLHFYDFNYKPSAETSYRKEEEGEPEDITIEEAVKEREIEEKLNTIYFEDSIRYKETAKRINSGSKYGGIKRVKRMVEGVGVRLDGVFVRKDKFYLKLRFDNVSPYPFDIEEVGFSYNRDKGHNRQTAPESFAEPIYAFDTKIMSILPDKNRSKAITFVFDRFFVEKGKYLFVTVYERGTERKIVLPIHSHYVNNPITLQKDFSAKFYDELKEQERQQKEEMKHKHDKKEPIEHENTYENTEKETGKSNITAFKS